jgi:uncharacterized protein
MDKNNFHLALPTNDLGQIKEFYSDRLGCAMGRTDNTWLDVDFFGHQLTFQEIAMPLNKTPNPTHPLLGYPLAHAGIILSASEWKKMKDFCEAKSISLMFGPQTLMEGTNGEQQVFMISDPDENVWEFKCFKDPGNVFLSNE